ncbi:DUF3592 domain-containing protein [bacterium]|nr:DUF3592 domain-containing protein [bacterium]
MNRAKNLIGVFLIGFGLVSLCVFLYLFYKNWDIGSWKKVEGEVIGAGIRRLPNQSDAAENDSVYYPFVKYTYVIYGKKYTSSSYAVFRPALEKAEVVELLKSYEKGSKIIVFYNHAEPHEAYLNRSYKGIVFERIIIVVIPLALGLFLFFKKIE